MPTRRFVATISIGLPALLILSACSSGTVNDARRAQATDAEQTPIVPVQQATRIAQRYFPGTATPSVGDPLYPFVGQMAVTVAVNGDGSPQGAYASVPVDAGTVYVAALLQDASPGQRITAIWTDQYGNVLGEPAIDLQGAGNPRWVALPLSLNGALAAGPHAVWLYAGEWRIGSLAFQLTGPGSAPQVYSELPANPQAPAPSSTEQPPTQPAGGNPPVQPSGDGQQQSNAPGG